MPTSDRSSSTPGNAASDVRALGDDDIPNLVDLLLAIPAGEHLFVKHDISRPEAVRTWLDDTPAHWHGAHEGNRLIGAVAVVPGEGWSSHVAELRMVVHPDRRRSGIGAALAKSALVAAIEEGYVVITVQALAQQSGVLNLFRGLGFVPEALLSDHVREPNGTLHDLVVLNHSVEGAAHQLSALGRDT